MAEGAGSHRSESSTVPSTTSNGEGAAPTGAAPLRRVVRTTGERSAQRVMPTDYSIAVRDRRAARQSGAPTSGPRRQSMRGFEDTYVDIVDYIVRITHRIWEDQDVGYIYDTYAPACRVYDDGGPRHGIEQMVDRHDPARSAPSPTCATTPTR